MPGDEPITRERVIDAVRAAVEPREWARAMYVAGSEACPPRSKKARFGGDGDDSADARPTSGGRIDEWSDVDVGLAVRDGRVDEGFAAVESALTSLAQIELCWRINPSTHEKPQRLYRLAGASPFLLVDVGVLPVSTPPEKRFVERRRHGTPRVIFDRDGFTADVPQDAAAWRERLRARLADVKLRFDLMQAMPVKSARRGDVAEAVVLYQAFTLRPLVEVLRMRHDPWRFDFDVRYLRRDLPDDVRRRVEALWLVRDLDELLAKRAEAEAWFREAVAGLDLDALDLR